MATKPYRMSDYVEEYVRSVLGIGEDDPIPVDIFDRVTEYQHDNDVIDGGKVSESEVEHCINTMGQKSEDDETPARRKAREAKLKKELDKLRQSDADAEAENKTNDNQISPPKPVADKALKAKKTK